MLKVATRLWALAGLGVIANLSVAGAAFTVVQDRSWQTLLAWGLLGFLLLYPLILVWRLRVLDDRAPGVLTHTDGARMVLGAVAPALLALVLLLRALTSHYQ